MSLTSAGEVRPKTTVASLREKKLHHEPITCLTAYDYSSARLIDEAGEVRLPLAAITRAKLVLTEDLLAATQPKPALFHGWKSHSCG